jgi:hypothetical protein
MRYDVTKYAHTDSYLITDGQTGDVMSVGAMAAEQIFEIADFIRLVMRGVDPTRDHFEHIARMVMPDFGLEPYTFDGEAVIS